MVDQTPWRKVLEDLLISLLMDNERPLMEDAPDKMKTSDSWPTGRGETSAMISTEPSHALSVNSGPYARPLC